MQHQIQRDFARIIFLKKFTEEIISNIRREYETEENIEVGRFKQKIEPRVSDKEFKQIMQEPVFEPAKYYKSLSISPAVQQAFRPRFMPKIFHKKQIQKMPLAPEYKKSEYQIPPDVQPVAEKRPEGFSIGKLDSLLKDPTIQSIECSGPDQKILVKRNSQINITQFSLSQQEINQIADIFSKDARIPIVNGILKAIVGDLIISAVLSDFAGSRFIINRITRASQFGPNLAMM